MPKVVFMCWPDFLVVNIFLDHMQKNNTVSQICHFYSDVGAHIIVRNPLACKHTCNLHLHSTPEYQPVVSPGLADMKTTNGF